MESEGLPGLQAMILMGHSTGCQDAVRYAERFGGATDGPPLLGYILQAPVSCPSIDLCLGRCAQHLKSKLNSKVRQCGAF